MMVRRGLLLLGVLGVAHGFQIRVRVSPVLPVQRNMPASSRMRTDKPVSSSSTTTSETPGIPVHGDSGHERHLDWDKQVSTAVSSTNLGDSSHEYPLKGAFFILRST